MIDHAFHDAVRKRLAEAAVTKPEQFTARTVLAEIDRWSDSSGQCSKIARDLGKLLDMDKGAMARSLALLESISAIRREQRGKAKAIVLTPPRRRGSGKQKE